MSSSPRLVVAAHGSTDARFAAVVESLADQVRRRRPDLQVVTGYLEHGPPWLSAAATPGAVVVPLLLSAGHHVTVDIPARTPGCRVAPPVGPDEQLVPVLVRRLREAGWAGEPVLLAAAGSTRPAAVAEISGIGDRLAAVLGVDITVGFLSAAQPAVRDLLPVASIASYLLAPGSFHDTLVASGAPVISAPLGDAPELAAVILDRYADYADEPVAGRG